MKKILHVASHHINVGDGALIWAIQNRLKHVAGEALHFDNIDVVDFDASYGGLSIETLNFDQYDLILVGGGGTIDARRDRIVSGMAFPLGAEQIRQLNTPLAYIGLGYNLFYAEPFRCKDALINVIEACKARNFPFSVRNDTSLERLRHAIGTTGDYVEEIPDPGYFIQADPNHHAPQFIDDHHPRIILQIAADNAAKRYSTLHNDLWNRVLTKLSINTTGTIETSIAALISWLVQTFDAHVVLAPHITTDLQITANIINQVPKKIRRKSVRVLGVAHPQKAPQYFSGYADADLIIGMRGHSVICAVGLGRPCIGLSSHPKIRGFMEKCGLEDYVLDYSDNFLPTLQQMVERMFQDTDSYHQRRITGTRDFEIRFDNFIRKCWHLIETTEA